jgi:hypothetical protein
MIISHGTNTDPETILASVPDLAKRFHSGGPGTILVFTVNVVHMTNAFAAKLETMFKSLFGDDSFSKLESDRNTCYKITTV